MGHRAEQQSAIVRERERVADAEKKEESMRDIARERERERERERDRESENERFQINQCLYCSFDDCCRCANRSRTIVVL